MNYWILQCNPNKYRMIAHLKEKGQSTDTWAISQQAKEIELEDTVFIWLANEKGKNNRGIYAMAKITGLPDSHRYFDRDDPNWIDKAAERRLSHLPSLELRYIKLIVDNPLSASDLKAAGLESLLILRMPQRGIYRLKQEEGEKIKRMIEFR